MTARTAGTARADLRPGEKVGVVLAAVALVAAPTMVGSVHPSTSVVLSSLCVIALWGLMVSRVALPRAALVAALVAALLWMALTLVPVPAGWLGLLSPAALARWDSPLLTTGPSLSCAPGATALEVVKMAGAVAVLGVAGALGQRPRGRRAILLALAGSGLVVAVVSVLQTLLGVDRVLGLYEPVAGAVGGFRTPFVNPNHAAQYFELTGLVALGGAARSRGEWRAGLVAVGVLLLGAALGTGSGAAMIVVPVGVAMVTGLALARRRRWIRWVVPALTGVGGAAALVAGVAFEEPGKWLHSSKLAHVPEVVQLIGDEPLIGVGRGGFRDAFAAYSPSGGFVRYTHAESEPLHLLAELGVPIAALLMMVVIGTWVYGLARWRRDPAAAGALAGTFAVGVHSTVEFGLEFGGVGLPFVVALGALLRPSRAEPPRWLSRPGSFGVAAAATAALALAPVALLHGSWTLELRAIEGAGDADLDEVVRRALRWSPCSPDVANIAGYGHLVRDRPSDALPLLNRAMTLDPRNPAPHLQAAHALESMGARGQAAIEVGAALRLDPGLGPTAFGRLARLVEGPDHAVRCLGNDLDLAAAFAVYLDREHPGGADGRALALRVVESDSTQPAACRVVAAGEWSAGRHAEALARLAGARTVHPCDVELVKYEASLRRGAGDAETALEATRAGLDCKGPDVELFYQEVMCLIALERYGEAHQSTRRMRDAATGHSAKALAAAADGRLAVAEGHLLRAKGHYVESLRNRPDRVQVRLELGKVYRELGRDREALKQFERVREETGAYPFLDDWILELRAVVPDGGAEAIPGG